MGKLIDELKEYKNRDVYPFHMPGHKRANIWSCNPYDFDITEIEGFDDLHNAKNILSDLQNRFSKLYGGGKVFLTVNGSTVGILASISAVVDSGDTLLIGRNCHKSVYNAGYIRKAGFEYIYPENHIELGISMAIKANDVENRLKSNPKIKAVIITCPTYEGILSDIESIAAVTHKYNAVLIVDGAHGAHFGITYGHSLTSYGADIVIMSIHKTLPSPTQTALVWVTDNQSLIERVGKFIDIYETSSPSYLLMCGAEKCLDYIENKGNFYDYTLMLQDFRNKCSSLKKLFVLQNKEDLDIGKIIIGTSRTDISGNELKIRLLERYNIELEMASEKYALAMTSIMDTREGFERLYNALVEIDNEIASKAPTTYPEISCLDKIMEIYEAEKFQKKSYRLSEAVGKISGEFIHAYPPGIPWVVPGEVISQQMINQICRYMNAGIDIRGIHDKNRIWIIER